MEKYKKAIYHYLYRLNHGMMPSRINPDKQESFDPVNPAQRNRENQPEQKNRPGLHILLFLITLFTTTWAGAHQGETLPELLASGLPYSLTLLAILLTHEFGHYFAARSFGVQATLPFFIPFPSLIGTMGAVIKTKSPIPHRKALFYIGAMGPLPGFILSLAAVTYGITVSEIAVLPPPGGDYPVLVFGDSLLFSLIVKIVHGPIPAGHDIFLSPYAWAGWIGFLITGLNLMPLGQLDGAHILYSLIGRKQVLAGWAALAGLIILSFIWYGWIVWVVLTLAFLMVAHPYVPKKYELTMPEKALGWFCMLILIMTFIPVPVEMM